MNKLLTTSALTILSNNLFGVTTVLIQNDFDSTTSGDIGPAFQLLSNGVDGNGSFDPATGIVTNTASDTNASGFNNIAVTTIPAGTTELTVTFEISGATNFSAIQSNGFFLGLVTGTDANGTAGSSLFNNNPSSIGLNLFPNNARIARDGATGNASAVQTLTAPSVASIEDGFSFTLTLRDDNTFDASSIGLSEEITITGAPVTGTDPTFSTFLSGGVAINGSAQGNAVSFTIDSVELSVESVPEPSTSMLFGIVSGLALFSRRRRRF